MDRAWQVGIGTWLTALVAAGRPASTIELRRYQLHRIAGALTEACVGPWQVTGDDLIDWLARHDWAPETRRSWRAALRSFYSWAHGTGRVQANPALAIPSVKPTEPNPKPTPEPVYNAAIGSADDRVQLMVLLGAELGMRRAEVAVVHRRDLEEDLDGWTLVVHGKGNKIRRLPLTDEMAGRIRRATVNGYAFPGRIDGHLSPKWVGKLVARELDGAWAMHSLRHRFASVAYSKDRDIVSVKDALGHSSLVTTQRYVRRPNDALRRMITDVSRHREAG